MRCNKCISQGVQTRLVMKCTCKGVPARLVKILTLLMFALSFNGAYAQGTAVSSTSEHTSSPIIKIPSGNYSRNNFAPGVNLLSATDRPSANLVTDKQNYTPGNIVRFTFTINNDKSKSYHYEFPSTRQFDIVVSNGTDQVIWKLPSLLTSDSKLTAFDLKPGQHKVYTAVWAIPINTKPGIYNIEAVLTTQIRPAIRSGLIINTDNDPNNVGMPTISNTETGAAMQVNTLASVSASHILVIKPVKK